VRIPVVEGLARKSLLGRRCAHTFLLAAWALTEDTTLRIIPRAPKNAPLKARAAPYRAAFEGRVGSLAYRAARVAVAATAPTIAASANMAGRSLNSAPPILRPGPRSTLCRGHQWTLCPHRKSR